jgi:hypothetical protein
VIISIPSWVNEKKENVSIERSLALAMPLSSMIFVLLGLFGGMAFPKFQNGQTILVILYGLGSKLAKITFFLFPACVNLTSIPVFSIMQRYNLVESGVCGRKMALFIAVCVPWIVSIPLYTGAGYQLLVTWSGILITSVVNFVVPPALYLLALRRTAQESEQRKVVRAQTLQRGSTMGSSIHGRRGSGSKVTRIDVLALGRALSEQDSAVLGSIHTPRKAKGAAVGDMPTPEVSPSKTAFTSSPGGPDLHTAVDIVPPDSTAAPPTTRPRAESLGRRLSMLAVSAKNLAADLKDAALRRKKDRARSATRGTGDKQTHHKKRHKEKVVPEPEEEELPPMPLEPLKPLAVPPSSPGQWRRIWWALMLPTSLLMHFTIPHASSLRDRGQITSVQTGVVAASPVRMWSWFCVSVASALVWTGGLAYLLLWCASLVSNISNMASL